MKALDHIKKSLPDDKEMHNEVSLYKARLNRLKKDKRLSVRDEKDINKDFNELSFVLLEFIKNTGSSSLEKSKHSLEKKKTKEKINLTKLPAPGNIQFVGRKKELRKLHKAWKNNDTRIISIVGMGGEGKTELVRQFLYEMEGSGFKKAKRVYAWSFFSQGSKEERAASADDFINEALSWFRGTTGPQEGTIQEKCSDLAHEILLSPTLLVLDGLEPLQFPTGELQGWLKDKTMAEFLRLLSRGSGNNRLCIITSRQSLSDLSHKRKSHCPELKMEGLLPKAGVRHLKNLGIKGKTGVLKEIVEEFEGHAFGLTLLGKYLSKAYFGRGDRWKEIKLDEVLEDLPTSVVHKFCGHLSNKHLAILRLLGLFDRPAEDEIINKLIKSEIDGLTTQLKDLNELEWNVHMSDLFDYGLIVKPKENYPKEIDAHPIVREYFKRVLRRDFPDAWKLGHLALFHHFESAVPNKTPNDSNELMQLYRAVSHACLAERHQQAFDEVYLPRILQGIRGDQRQESWRKFGTFGTEVATLANFFSSPWDEPHTSLKLETRGILQYAAGFCLGALGRLGEAEAPLKRSYQILKNESDKAIAAMCCGYLAQELPFLGKLEDALKYAQESVDLADNGSDLFQPIRQRCVLAHSFHQLGRFDEARSTFQEAEKLQGNQLYSLLNFLYCDLLIDIGDFRLPEGSSELKKLHNKVLTRTEANLIISTEKNWLLPIGLSYLTLSQVYFRYKDFESAEKNLEKALNTLKDAGRQDFLVRGLIERAAFYRKKGNQQKARAELSEASEIAQRGMMKLYLCDIEIERYYIEIAQDNPKEAKEHLVNAKKEIEAMKYYRRKNILEINL